MNPDSYTKYQGLHEKFQFGEMVGGGIHSIQKS